MKSVLITGGSSGIGYELTKKFIHESYHIFWVSLDEAELQAAKAELLIQFPNGIINFLAIDLSKLDAQEKVYNWFLSHSISLDIFINNAGFGVYGYTLNTSIEKEINMLQLNVINSFKLCKIFLCLMNNQGYGHIINICSNTSFQPVPKMAAYAASKAFLSSYSLALTEELKQLNSDIKVLTVYPAAIQDTQFKVTSAMEKVRTFEGLLATTKKEVANDVWIAMKKNKKVILSGSKHRRLQWLIKITPNAIINWMMTIELKEK